MTRAALVLGSVKAAGFDSRRVTSLLSLFFVGVNYWGLNEKVSDENACLISTSFHHYNFRHET